MSDNTTLNAGSGGDTIATDDIAGIKHQRVKAEWGPNGTATEVDTGASALPIQDGGNSITVDGTVTVQDGGSTISVDDGAGSLTVDNAVLSVVGGGTEAAAQRVTLASDSTGVLSVDDNGGSLTVDVGTALPAGTNELGKVRITDGTLTASVRDTGSSDSLNVAIVDASGNQITAFGTPTEYTEDAAAAANPVGGMLIARRRDTPTAAEVSADGDNIALITTAEGYLRTAVSGTVTVADGGGAISVDDSGGSLTVDDGGTSLTVDGTVAVTGIGTGASDLGKVEDTAAINGDTGVAVLAVRRDSATAGVSADGDYANISVDSTGALRVTGGGGGTEYVEDVASAADPTGNALIVVRDDARAGSITSANGDNVALRGTNAGELYVKQTDTVPARVVDLAGNSCMDEANNALQVSVVAGSVGGSGGTSMADDAAFTVGTTSITPVGGTYRTSRDALDDNDGGAIALTQTRGQYVTLESAAGTAVPTGGGAEANAIRVTVATDSTGVLSVDDNGSTISIDDGAGSITVDGTVAVSGITGLTVLDDAAFTVGTTPVTPIAGTYRSARDSVDDNDAGALAMTAKRGLFVAPETAAGLSMSDESLGALKVSPQFAIKVDDTVATGTIDANGEVVGESADGRGTVGIDLTGTFVGTLAFEGTVDGSTWFSVDAFAQTLPGETVTGATAAGRWAAVVGGLNLFRVRATAWTSGSVDVRLNLSLSSAPYATAPVWTNTTLVAAIPAGTNNIGDVDVLSIVPGTGATSLGKAEDAAAVSGDTGVAVLAVRRDSASSGVGTDGDYANLSVDSTGALRVTGGGGGTQFAEDAAAVSGDTGTLALAVRRDTAASSSGTDGDYSTLNVNSTGRLYTSSTVDAALPAGTNNIGDVDVLTLVPGTGATALGKAEDAAAGSGDTGVAMLAVRRDTPGTGIGADGDYAFLEVDSTGALRVNVVTGGSGAVQGIDAHDAAITAAPVLTGARASAAAPTNVSADNDAVELWALRSGALATQITAAGALVGGDATNGLDVDVTRVTGQFAEDAVAASGDLGNLVLAVRRDTAASSSGTDGDYSTLNVNSTGRLYTSTTVDAALPAGTNNIGDVDVLTMPSTVTEDAASVGAETMVLIGGVRRDTAASSSGTDGDYSTFNLDSTGRLHANITGTATGPAAHDAAVSGNPVLQGLEARTSDGTAVTNGDVVRPMASTLGKQVVHVGSIPANQIQGNFNETNNTASDVIAAQASGIKVAVMSITAINKHATVSTTITIRDGTTAKIGPLQCKADGGGFHMTGGGFPLFIGTAATAVTVLAGTTGSDVDITITGYLTTE